jgi:formamidopyrimidine-DNA glycosylase
MPELPEVEAIIRRLRPHAIGATIASVDVLRPRTVFPQKPAQLAEAEGRRIEAIDRRGKNIIVRLSRDGALRIHLRMTGILCAIPDTRLHGNTTRVLFTLKDGSAIAFEDRRILGTVHYHCGEEIEAKLASLGVEPLSRAFTEKYLLDRAARSIRPMKLFLMDQTIIAGLGNIYTAESLFAAKIHPAQPAKLVAANKLRALHADIPKVLRTAVRNAVKTYSAPDRHEGMHFNVYRHKGEPCTVCGKTIKTLAQGGRTTYFCPNCQRK